MSTTEHSPAVVTLVHSTACHFCDDAAATLDALAATHPLEIRTVALDSPEGVDLVARHRPAMNPLVLIDGEYFSSGRLPRKKLIKQLDERAAAGVR